MRKRPKALNLHDVTNHPIRFQVLRHAVRSKQAISTLDTSIELGHPINTLRYHFGVLADAGVFELQQGRPKEGTIEYLYAPSQAVLTDPFVKSILARSSGEIIGSTD